MRFLALFLSVFILAPAAQAKCGSRGLYAYPSEAEISSNSLILLEGYGLSREVLQGLNTKYPVYLLSDKGEKVNLIVKEYNEGQFYLAQVLLQPERVLEMGESYSFLIDSLPQYEALQRYNYGLEKFEKVRFTVSKAADTEKPELRSGPVFKKEEYEMLGCGPMRFMHFSMKIKDASLLLVKATVTESGTGKSSTYYELSDGGEVALGHGMCSGAFVFEPGKEYDVRFSFTDLSGNESGISTEPVHIQVSEQAAAE